MTEKPLTVGQLIEHLAFYDPALPLALAVEEEQCGISGVFRYVTLLPSVGYLNQKQGTFIDVYAVENTWEEEDPLVCLFH